MKKYIYPAKSQWKEIAERPVFDSSNLDEVVSSVLDNVLKNGNQALIEYTEKFDRVKLNSLQVSDLEIKEAIDLVDDSLKDAINLAAKNIEIFHESQKEEIKIVSPVDGVKLWRKSSAIDKIGLYIPGGTAPLFSTILMLAIPAKVAGCQELILCTPPNKEGEVNPAILYTANLVGIDKIFKVGGAQAIGALAYGTETIPSVYKIFGPGNQFVTKAKELVQTKGVAIDLPAGPSELLVIADKTSKPAFVASDLLSQAEHGTDSQVILLTDSMEVANAIEFEVEKQLQNLSRKNVAEIALNNSKIVILDNLNTAFELSNYYSPEHLIVALENSEDFIDLISTAGSVFLGNYSPESAGDYASGTNHTLPTNSFARNYSGVSLDSFVKKITFQNINPTGLKNIGPAIEKMAEAELLDAHKNAVTIRLKEIDNV